MTARKRREEQPGADIVVNPIEAELNFRLWERTFPFIRNALLAASLLFLMFLAWDYQVDITGAVNTLPGRLAAAGYYALMYILVTYTRAGRRRLRVIYVTSVLITPVLILWLLLQIDGAYLLGHSSFLAVTFAAIVIGPTLWVSMPLALASLIVPDAIVLWMVNTGIDAPGLPDAAAAWNLAFMHGGVGVMVVVLAVVHDRLQRRTLIDNINFEQLAGTDPLTAVHNRRQLEAEFARERARQRRHGHPIGVLEIDIDRFKRVNDVHGHGIGDEVLRNLTRRWRELIREVDVLARVGGEEFVVLLPETDAGGARESAERLRTYTAAEAVSTSAGTLAITISIGVTLVAPNGAGLDEVLRRVDRALYRAKENGRNRCEFIEPDPERVTRPDG
jgi:diguanylate cyclase (GGDEF)-like protein